MTRKLKLISNLSTAAAVSALALSGCGGAEGEGESEAQGAENVAVAIDDPTAAIAGEAEGEGENEGEGAAAATGDPATDDVEYLYRLGMACGHLIAFMELYRAGAYDMAATHVKHPESELYAELQPAIAARDKPGFAGELEMLAEAVESRSDVEAAYEKTFAAIRNHMPETNARTKLMAVSRIVHAAADEFDIGVGDNGAVEAPHEYQDAYGFLTAAREILAEADTSDINAGEAIAVAHEQIDMSLNAFEGLTAGSTGGDASTLYGAASRIEIAALGL